MITDKLRRGQKFEYTLETDEIEPKTVFGLQRAELADALIFQTELQDVNEGRTDATTPTERAERKTELLLNYILAHLCYLRRVSTADDEITEKEKMEPYISRNLDDLDLWEIVGRINNGPKPARLGEQAQEGNG